MDFFDLIAPIYNRVHLGARRDFQRFYQLSHFNKSDRILDIGGGSGSVAKFFINQVKEVSLVDSSHKMIKECQKQTGIKCYLAKAEDLPFEDNHFDKIIISDAFHHFQDQNKAMKEIDRILKAGGVVLIKEFNPDRFFGGLLEKVENILGMKSKFHSPQSLATLFQVYKFKTNLKNDTKNVYYLICQKI